MVCQHNGRANHWQGCLKSPLTASHQASSTMLMPRMTYTSPPKPPEPKKSFLLRAFSRFCAEQCVSTC